MKDWGRDVAAIRSRAGFGNPASEGIQFGQVDFVVPRRPWIRCPDERYALDDSGDAVNAIRHGLCGQAILTVFSGWGF